MTAPTNDFLPIAIAGTPNVQAQGDYAGSTPQVQGYADHAKPPAKAFNKMVRQASCFAAIVAQVICNLTGANMPDDGDQNTKIALFQGMFRTRLTGATTFYISTAGNDSTGDGSSGSPWRTAQHAVDTLLAKYDFAGFGVQITRADSVSAYTDPVIVAGRFVGQSGPLIFTASGSANVTVNVSSTAYCYEAFLGAAIQVQNQKLINSVGGGLYASQNGSINYSGLNFGACAGTAILADRDSRCISQGACTLSGNVSNFAAVDGTSSIEMGAFLMTITGTPAISGAFVSASDRGGILAVGTTFAGTFTGKRFNAEMNSVINTGSSGNLNFFPGTVAGTSTTGSQYA